MAEHVLCLKVVFLRITHANGNHYIPIVILIKLNHGILLFHHVLTSTYFMLNGKYYEQCEGLAMGSPLSPVVAKSIHETLQQSRVTVMQS